MLTIGLVSCLISCLTIARGARFFLSGQSCRALDRPVVAFLMLGAAFFVIVWAIALQADPVHMTNHHPATALWAGFDFYVAVLHFALMSAICSPRLCPTLKKERHA